MISRPFTSRVVTIRKRVVVFINMMTTALYLKYATKRWYLLSRILLTFLCNGFVIMICASIQVRPNKLLVYVSVKTEHLIDSLPYIYINGNNVDRVSIIGQDINMTIDRNPAEAPLFPLNIIVDERKDCFVN